MGLTSLFISEAPEGGAALSLYLAHPSAMQVVMGTICSERIVKIKRK